MQFSLFFQLDTLISNVGGNLGLFIGMSIVSFFELLEYVIDMLLILISPTLYAWTLSEDSSNNNVAPKKTMKKPKSVFILSLNDESPEVRGEQISL